MSSVGKVVAALALLLFVGSSLALLPSPVFASSPTSASPLWAFNGAYATYSYSFRYDNLPALVEITATLSNVNSSAQTFNYKIRCSGSYCTVLGVSPNGTGSFDIPEFPAVSTSVLKSLNGGRNPGGSAGSVTSNTTVTVPAGTMKADRVVNLGSTLWVDTESGLYVQVLEPSPSNAQGVGGPLELQLLTTNIPTTASGSQPFAVLIVALAVVAACVVSVFDYSALGRVRRPQNGQQGKSEVDRVDNASVL